MIGSGFSEHVLECSIRLDYVEVVDGAGAQTSVLTVKKNDYGLWQQVWPHGTPAATFLQNAMRTRIDPGRLGCVYRQPDSDVIVASGPLTTMIDSYGRRNGVAGDAMSAWGVTDLTHLRERTIFPVPTDDIPVSNGTTTHAWAAFTRPKSGPAETVALDYIRENIGSTALARRRLPCELVIPASLGRGPTVSVAPQANKNVLEVVQQLMTLAGLVIDIKQSGQGQLSLSVRTPVRRGGIVWMTGEGGTAAGLSIKTSRRPKTDVINSGSGDDPATVYVRRVATPPPGGFSEVREEFIKGSGDDAAELVADADAELIEDGPEYGLDVEPAEGFDRQLGIHYEVGDITVASLPADETDFEADADFDVPVNTVLLRHESGTLTEEPTAAFDDDFSIEPLLRRIFRRITRAER